MQLRGARILISNDDGINSPGLKVLEKIAKSFSPDVWVVAPESEKSASGHSLTINLPLRVRKINGRKFAVDGTPADSVLVAVQHLMMEKKPDLVLSGINAGGNLGEDIAYSGTVAAAMEGTLLGIPAIALSQARVYGEKVRWEASLQHGPRIIRKITQEEWPKNVLINVNFPDLPAKKIGGTQITFQGRRKIGDKIREGRDPRGYDYLWIGNERREDPSLPGSDLKAVNEGRISITPLCLDLTHRPTMAAFRRVF